MQLIYMVGQCHNIFHMIILNFIKMFTLEEILNTEDDNEIGYFIECDLKYPDNIKQKTKYFPFCPE